MKNLGKVKALFSDPKAAKIISTISAEGELHAIVAGTVVVLNEDTLAFAEVYMKKTAKNLSDNGKIAILAEKGMDSYLVNGKNLLRHTDDAIYTELSDKFAFLGRPILAIWTCEIDKIFNQGGNPEVGTQLF